MEEAGIATGPHELIARVEGPGRVVLEGPTALLAALQKTVATSKLERNIRGSLIDHLLEERQNDSFGLPATRYFSELKRIDALSRSAQLNA